MRIGSTMHRSPEQIRQSLFSLTSKGINYDLERITAAADRSGNPHNAYPSIHVAGTNGKGSTCAFIETVLRGAGFTTGLFTSPHIVAFEERFRMNGKMVAEEEWIDVYYQQQTIIESYHLTFFESGMLIASELFRRRGVEWAVFETGLGGRFDATNILRPRVSVITRLAIDHREYLGDTLAEIAREKLGIVKERTPLVAADPDDPGLHRLIEATCRAKEAPCTFVAESDASEIASDNHGAAFHRNGIPYATRLAGRFQIVNALCAIEAIGQSGLTIDADIVQKGIAGAFLPGRFQRLAVSGKTVILDVGHNPDSAAVFVETLRSRFPGKPVCLVAGIMADKDYPAMIALYAAVARHIIFTKPKTDRAAAAETLAACLPEDRRTVCPDVGEAVRTAMNREEAVVCVTGSFYTVGEATAELGNMGLSPA
ncbi:MAG: bifunctional folylpolyglutamate synthase/dihydrofolate synthase [Chitinispirillaceae bacterium]|nr:bifunctional folylpolyglutamate synthase/dihydrofolate synthase [Chitinispirillaceae bacterium]